MAGHGSKSDQQREAAIVALLSHPSVQEAARAAGIGATTLFHWLKEPEFNARLREARRQAFSQSITQMVGATSAAVTTLLKVMGDPKTPAATKVRAADIILDHAAKAIDIEDIQARLTALEDAYAATSKGQR